MRVPSTEVTTPSDSPYHYLLLSAKRYTPASTAYIHPPSPLSTLTSRCSLAVFARIDAPFGATPPAHQTPSLPLIVLLLTLIPPLIQCLRSHNPIVRKQVEQARRARGICLVVCWDRAESDQGARAVDAEEEFRDGGVGRDEAGHFGPGAG